MSDRPRSSAARVPLEYRVVVLQACVLGVGTLAAMALAMAHGSFLAGGCCALFPNAWMAWRVRRRSQRDESLQAIGMMMGAIEKMCLTAGLLAFALSRIEDLNAPAFFAGFIVALATHHAAPILDAEQGRET